MYTAMQTQISQGYTYKEWKQEKQIIEDKLIKDLSTTVGNKDGANFRVTLLTGIAQLEEIYLKLPPSGTNTDGEKVIRNKKLRTFFGEMCKRDVKSDFITQFLDILPIANEPIVQLQGQYPLHLAIGSQAFDNAHTLLTYVADIDVNVLWKKQTPLMLLFKLASTSNFPFVEKLVQLLADKRADINLGDYTAHPLSVLCRLTTIDAAQKRRLCSLCAERFECDVDNLYNGQARKDVEQMFPDIRFEKRRVEVTAVVLRSLLLASNEDDFLKMFDEFYHKSDRLMDTVELLQLAASKRLSRSVEKIFVSIQDIDLIPYRKPVSKILKIVCSKGYPEVLELFLNYIRQPEVFNELPLALICVRSMQNQRTAELEECFAMLLGDDKVSIAKCDNNGDSALSFAREYDMNQEVMRIIENEIQSTFLDCPSPVESRNVRVTPV